MNANSLKTRWYTLIERVDSRTEFGFLHRVFRPLIYTFYGLAIGLAWSYSPTAAVVLGGMVFGHILSPAVNPWYDKHGR